MDWSQLAVFLFDEEEGGGVWALRWYDVSLFEVFLDEDSQCFPLFLSEGVDLSWEHGRGVLLQLDGMVPDPWFGESLCLFLAEDLGMLLIFFWQRRWFICLELFS